MALDARTMLKRMMIGNLDMGLFLIMRPNPQTFQKTESKIVSEQLTNSGFVDTHWGNNRDVITVSGVTASKIGTPNMYKNSEFLTSTLESMGNQFISGHSTAAHGPKQWADVDRFLLKLEQIYKTDKERVGSLAELIAGSFNPVSIVKNMFTKSTFKDTNDKRNELMKSIQNGYATRAQSFIIYDYCIYWGYFTQFSYTESAIDKPRQYSYNFTFKVVNSSTDWLSQSLISNFPEARIIGMFSQIGNVAEYGIGMLTQSDKILKGVFL